MYYSEKEKEEFREMYSALKTKIRKYEQQLISESQTIKYNKLKQLTYILAKLRGDLGALKRLDSDGSIGLS